MLKHNFIANNLIQELDFENSILENKGTMWGKVEEMNDIKLKHK